jgi:hypothetical protein
MPSLFFILYILLILSTLSHRYDTTAFKYS